MTDANYTHEVLLIDRSGSMGEFSDPPNTKAQDATRGVHEFIREQRKLPGKVTFTLVEFNTIRHEVVKFSGGLELLPSRDHNIDGWVCNPHGGTALLDAIGSVITTTGTALHTMQEQDKPGKVVFLIWTDGVENASKKYNLEKVRAMIEHQEQVYNWQFVYQGIGPEAYRDSAKYGFTDDQSVFVAGWNTAASYGATNTAVADFRSGATASVAYAAPVRQRLASEKPE